MADWKSHISYNYNPSYHAYAYGLMYPPGPEQNHGNPVSWGEPGITDLSNNNAGMTQAYYTAAATARTREESPPRSPEEHAVDGHCHYQGSGVVYLGDTQAGRLLLTAPHRAAYDGRAHEDRRAGSDSTSDSEAYISPDSWSSGSSREGSLPQADPVTWAKKDLDDEESSRSPDGSEDVSSSLMEEPVVFVAAGNEPSDNMAAAHAPLPAPKKPSTSAANNPKAKARAAFSESQMNVLVHRFSVQRYLPPAEMKNLAEVTGLTYKQVKTWFQNRRMKLRRHQKDTSWVSGRYATNKDSPARGNVFNMPAHIPPGEVRPQLKEHYSQNLAIYLAAMGPGAGPAGYPSWSSGPPQAAVPGRPQAAGWSMPPSVTHYEYNPSAFASVNNTGHDTSKDCEAADGRGSLNAGVAHGVAHGVGQ